MYFEPNEEDDNNLEDASKEKALSIFKEVQDFVRGHELSSYDSAYVELARRLRIPLASLDLKLQRAAMAAGVSRFVV